MAPSCDYRSGISLLASVLCAACLAYGVSGQPSEMLIGETRASDSSPSSSSSSRNQTAINSTRSAPVTQPSQIVTSLLGQYPESNQDDLMQGNSSKSGNFSSSKDADMSSARESDSKDKVTQSIEEAVEQGLGDIFWPVFTVIEDPSEAGYPTRTHRPPFVDEGDKKGRGTTSMSPTSHRQEMIEEATTQVLSNDKTTEELMKSSPAGIETVDNLKISERVPLTTAALDVDELQTTPVERMPGSASTKKVQHTAKNAAAENVTSTFSGVSTTSSRRPTTTHPKGETLPITELPTTAGEQIPRAVSDTSTVSESQAESERSSMTTSNASTAVLSRSSETGIQPATTTESLNGVQTTESPVSARLNITTARLMEKLVTTTPEYQTTAITESPSTIVHEIEATFVEIPLTSSTSKTEVSAEAFSNTSTPKLVQMPATTALPRSPSVPENETTHSSAGTSVGGTELQTTSASHVSTPKRAEKLQTTAHELTLIPEIATSAGKIELSAETVSPVVTPQHVDMPLTTGQEYPSVPVLENATSAEARTTHLQNLSPTAHAEAETTAVQRKMITSIQFTNTPTAEFLTEATPVPENNETKPVTEIRPSTVVTPHPAQTTVASTTSVVEHTSETSKGQMPTVSRRVFETVSTSNVEQETRAEMSYVTAASETKMSTASVLSTTTSASNESFTSVGVRQTVVEDTSSKSASYGVYNITSFSPTKRASTSPGSTVSEPLTTTKRETSTVPRIPETTAIILEDTMSYEAEGSEYPSTEVPTTESEEPTAQFIEETTAFEEPPTTTAGLQTTASRTETVVSTKRALPVTGESSTSSITAVGMAKGEASTAAGSSAVVNMTMSASTAAQFAITTASHVMENTTVPVTTSTPLHTTTGSSAPASDTSTKANVTEEYKISFPMLAQSVSAGSEDYTAEFIPLSSTESSGSEEGSTTKSTSMISSYPYEASGEVTGASSPEATVELMKNATNTSVSQGRTSSETTAISATTAGLLLNATSSLMNERTTNSSLESTSVVSTTSKVTAPTELPELVSEYYPSSSKRSTEIVDTSETYSGEIVTEYIQFENETESASAATSELRSKLTSALTTTEVSVTTNGTTSAGTVTRREAVMNATEPATQKSATASFTVTTPSSSTAETEMETALFITELEPLPPGRTPTTGAGVGTTINEASEGVAAGATATTGTAAGESTRIETLKPITAGSPALENTTVPNTSFTSVPLTTASTPVPTTTPEPTTVSMTTVPTTAEPTTTVPTTAEPTTTVPTTAEPTAIVVSTAAPTTIVQTSPDQTTTVPTTAKPTTTKPTTMVPTTSEPTTTVPTTPELTTTVPTTPELTTPAPTTPEHTTTVPTTPEPTTPELTTPAPTTPEHTTTVPTTPEPTTTVPTTAEPTSPVPTTPELTTPTPTTPMPTTPQPTTPELTTPPPTAPEPTTTVPITPEPTTTVPTTPEPTTTVPTTPEPTTTVPTTPEPTTTVPTTPEPTTTVPTTPEPTTTVPTTPELTTPTPTTPAPTTPTPTTPTPTTPTPTTPTPTTPKSTTELTTVAPPSPNDVELSGRFKITGGVEWNDALTDKTSPEYKQLNNKMNNTIATTLKKTSAGGSFVRISKIDFKKGSVDVEYMAVFRPDTVIEVQDVEKTFRNEIANGTAFKGYTVDPNSTSFVVITPQPSSPITPKITVTTEEPLGTSSYLVPNWAIGIIIAAAILVIFIIIVVIVMCCTNNRKRKQQTYRIPRTAGKMIKEEGARYTIDPDTAGKYVVYVEKRPIDGDNGTVINASNDASSRQHLHQHRQHSPLSINTASYDGQNSVDLERNNSSSSASTLLARPIRMMPSPEGQSNMAASEELIDMNEICVVDERTNVTKPLDVTLDVTATASGSPGKLTSL